MKYCGLKWTNQSHFQKTLQCQHARNFLNPEARGSKFLESCKASQPRTPISEPPTTYKSCYILGVTGAPPVGVQVCPKPSCAGARVSTTKNAQRAASLPPRQPSSSYLSSSWEWATLCTTRWGYLTSTTTPGKTRRHTCLVTDHVLNSLVEMSKIFHFRI